MQFIKSLCKKLIDGVIYGTGFVLFYSFVGGAGFIAFGDVSLYQVKSKLTEVGVLPTPETQKPDAFSSTVKKNFLESTTPIPTTYKIINVHGQKQFGEALGKIKRNKGNIAIILSPGEYHLKKTVYITDNNVHITSSTGNPYDVIIRGRHKGFKGSALFRVAANYFTLDGITLTDSPNHIIQIAGESEASYSVINNTILQDSYQQIVKVSYDKNGRPENFSYNGVVTNSVFQYTKGISPNYYTGGIDAIGAKDWRVENNIFRDIASPKDRISQHAVHFWVNSENTQILNNLFVDNDRAIGFGMPLSHNSKILDFSHKGGVISGNVIFHSDNGDPFGDVGIILEASSDAIIKDNVIYMEHSYNRAIEYRFETSKNISISNNKTNKSISSRNGGSAILSDNDESLSKGEFIASFGEIIARLGVVEMKAPLQ